MASKTSTAPGKIILFGEHAVVYNEPAIAVPVTQVRARAVVSPLPRTSGGDVLIQAPDIDLVSPLSSLPDLHPLRAAVEGVQSELHLLALPACKIRVTATIPLAAGMGSGAAISVALIRALAAFLGQPLSPERVSALAYEVEKLHHGTPSGIDNTVVTYALPVYFQRRVDRAPLIETFSVPTPFTILIADTGVPSPTGLAVGELRKAWQVDPEAYNPLFHAVGELVRQARQHIEMGDIHRLGPLMDENHALLCEMGVSSPELDRLVGTARSAGAGGAKLSGGGRGGNMIAFVVPERGEAVSAALSQAGAVRVIHTRIE